MSVKLIASALSVWDDLDGWSAGHGIDPYEMPLGRFVHFVWWWLTRNIQEQAEYDRVKAKLWIPPAGEAPQGPWSPEEETKAFAAVKAALNA